MSEFSVVPVEGESYEGRQWGWMILRDGEAVLGAMTGGTGPCWNLDGLGTTDEGNPQAGTFGPLGDCKAHVCDLDEFIEALTALRESDAHLKNVERWQ